MSTKTLVLVTGASGFLGSQIVSHLLSSGYAVRGTSRSSKAKELRQNNTHPDFEVATVDDLVKGDFTEALTGVDAIVHVASPLAKGNDMIEVAVEGTLNVVRQAYRENIYKVTLISSYASAFSRGEQMFDSSVVLTDQDWNEGTKEDAQRPGVSPWTVYGISKALAERALWEFAESHPKMDLVTILPAFIYGPMSESQVIKDPSMLSTNNFLYSLIRGEHAAYPATIPPQCVDVRDVARAVVLSLHAKAAEAGERRRILLCGGSFTWKQAASHIAKVRPDLKNRIIDRGEAAVDEVPSATVDVSNAEKYVGMDKFIRWTQSVEDAIEDILKRENSFN